LNNHENRVKVLKENFELLNKRVQYAVDKPLIQSFLNNKIRKKLKKI